MIRTLSVPGRFNGPEGVANGGWVSGTVAAAPPGVPVTVSLSAPTPLGAELTLAGEPGLARLSHAGRTLVEARPAAEAPQPPPFVPAGTAAAAERRFPGPAGHPFPHCFVCGFRDDGLGVHSGGTGAPGEVAARWTPGPEFAGPDGTLPAPPVWAALDCPTGWAHLQSGGSALLARFTVHVRDAVRTGRPHVIVARTAGREGRKLSATAGLYTADGALLAASAALWIVPA